MTRRPLNLDTAPEIERLQVDRWRAMSPAEKADLVTGLTQAASVPGNACISTRPRTSCCRSWG